MNIENNLDLKLDLSFLFGVFPRDFLSRASTCQSFYNYLLTSWKIRMYKANEMDQKTFRLILTIAYISAGKIALKVSITKLLEMKYESVYLYIGGGVRGVI